MFFLTPSLCVMFVFYFCEGFILYFSNEYCPFKSQADTLGDVLGEKNGNLWYFADFMVYT